MLRTGSCTHRPLGSRSRQPLRVRALFGWGQPKGMSEEDYAKEEAWNAQQELLAKRRSGAAIVEANERRRKVKSTMQERKAVRKAERDALGEGRMPETLAAWKPYMKKEDAEGTSGIVIPLLPFGMRKYDEGERFDLRSPYADDGWVDPEETDMWAGLQNARKKLLNLSGKQEEPQERKPVIWASQWAKYQAEQKQGKVKGQ